MPMTMPAIRVPTTDPNPTPLTWTRPMIVPSTMLRNRQSVGSSCRKAARRSITIGSGCVSLGQKPYAAGFELVHGSDQFHHAFRGARFGFGRLEDLAHRPAHVGFDRRAALIIGFQARPQVRQTGKDAVQ